MSLIGNHRTPFRAGRQAGEQPLDAAELAQAGMPPDFGAGITLLADVSEFQPDIADAAYLRWSKAIVIRAMYGGQHDAAWYGGLRRASLHSGGVKFLGIYQYLVAGQDPADQARELARLLGALQPGEKIICDLEEGGGDQAARRDAWKAVIEAELGDKPWVYSGEDFAATHGIAPVDWVAAFSMAEPPVQHKLWQFSDSFTVPGIGTCDCSVFHGGIDELAAFAWQPQPAGWTFPAPAARETRQTRSGFSLAWDAVTGPAGQVPDSYSVYTFDSHARLVNHQEHVQGLTAAEYGPAGRGLPRGTYSTRVWANGAPASPAHATVTVALAH